MDTQNSVALEPGSPCMVGKWPPGKKKSKREAAIEKGYHYKMVLKWPPH
jgi:hypothetical protein